MQVRKAIATKQQNVGLYKEVMIQGDYVLNIEKLGKMNVSIRNND